MGRASAEGHNTPATLLTWQHATQRVSLVVVMAVVSVRVVACLKSGVLVTVVVTVLLVLLHQGPRPHQDVQSRW
jgi:hypothetical protein